MVVNIFFCKIGNFLTNIWIIPLLYYAVVGGAA